MMRYSRRDQMRRFASGTSPAFWGADREGKMPNDSDRSRVCLRLMRTVALRWLPGADPRQPGDSLHTIAAPVAGRGRCRRQVPPMNQAQPPQLVRSMLSILFSFCHLIVHSRHLYRLQIRQDCDRRQSRIRIPAYLDGPYRDPRREPPQVGQLNSAAPICETAAPNDVGLGSVNPEFRL